MKKIVSLVLIAMTAFFMSGCDLIGEDVLDELPGISLVGESVMEVELYSEFVDPGAAILGEFELDVVVDSNVDTNTLGDYIITYTISYLSIEYEVSRTVRVVEVLSGDNPSLELVGEAVMQVVQYTEFVDPGVGILGEFDLDITIVSDVDSSIVGMYTVTYTINYLGIEYSLTRSVEVIYEVIIQIPSFELVGDAFMEVEQYSTFIDPGVLVNGSVGLDVVVESDLDTMTLGVYTITYTINHLGIEYSITRSVEVVMEIIIIEPSEFNIYFTESIISFTTINVTLTVEDYDGMLAQRYVRLFKDDVEVGNFEYIHGVNLLEFTGLLEGTDYKIVVTGEYLLEGSTEMVTGYELEFTTLEQSNMSFTFGELDIELHSVDFGFEILDEDSLITDVRANLYKDDVLVDYMIVTVEDFYITFYELIYNTEYEIKILFTYLPNGVTLPVTEEFGSITFTTLDIVEDPVLNVSSHTCDLYEDEIDCDFSLNNIGFNDLYLFAELYKDGVELETYDIWTDSYYYFYDLDPDTEYTIYLYSDFTYGGITYYNQLIGTYVYTTLEATVYYPPVITNVIVTKTADSVTVEFDLTDEFDSMERGRVKLLRGGSAVYLDMVPGHNLITFDSYIYENTLYSVIIEADYMGNGMFESIYTEDVYTPPVITVNSFEQTEMFFENDYVIMKLDIDNDEEVIIEFVTINGFRYDTFDFPSDIDTLYVNMGVYSSAGNYVMNLENVVITQGGEEVIIEMTGTDDVSVYLAGAAAPTDATVRVIDIVPQDYFVNISFDNPYETSSVVIDVYFDNPYNLPVSSITVGGVEYTGGDLTVLGFYHVQFTADFSYQDSPSNSTLYFGSVTFTRNSEIVVDNQSDHVDIDIYRIYDFDNDDTTPSVIHVSTPEDLMGIESDSVSPSTVFVLDNDIDMSGYNFIPIGTYEDKFTGAFDGNGYTISNITINQTYGAESPYEYVGIFGYSNARIINLVIDNATVNVTTTDDNYLFVGILSGTQIGDVYNVHIYNSTINVDGLMMGAIGGMSGTAHSNIIGSSADTDIISTQTTESEAYDDSGIYFSLSVGGLIGSHSYDDIRNSFATGDISVTSNVDRNVFTGGLVGVISGGETYRPNYIMNSYATGDVSATTDYYGRTGGLVGNVFWSSTSYIYNSYSSGDVNGNFAGTTGGLVGETSSYVTSSFTIGNVNSVNGTISRIFGSGNDYRLTNIYVYDLQIVTRDGSPIYGSDFYYIYIGIAGTAQFNDADYYIDFLGWSTHFFDFTNLDVENKVLPVLK